MYCEFKAAVLLNILLLTILVPDRTAISVNIDPYPVTNGSNGHYIAMASTGQSIAYKVPSTFSHTILPAKFIPRNSRDLSSQNEYQRRSDYSLNHALTAYHPIANYKISPTTHTSDG